MQGLNVAYLIGTISKTPKLLPDTGGYAILEIVLQNAVREERMIVRTEDAYTLHAEGKTADFLLEYAKKGQTLAAECVLAHLSEPMREPTICLRIQRVLWLSNKEGELVERE